MARAYRPYLVIIDGLIVWTASPAGRPSAAEIRAAQKKANATKGETR